MLRLKLGRNTTRRGFYVIESSSIDKEDGNVARGCAEEDRYFPDKLKWINCVQPFSWCNVSFHVMNTPLGNHSGMSFDVFTRLNATAFIQWWRLFEGGMQRGFDALMRRDHKTIKVVRAGLPLTSFLLE